MKTLLFQEKQSFRQIWLWLLLGVPDLIFLTAVYRQLIMNIPFGNNPMSDTGLIITGLLLLLLNLFFFMMQLRTGIHEEGIEVQFYPVHTDKRMYKWSDISEAYLREYRAISEFGGWGIRSGAYNVSGNIGLQLVFKNGDKLLIGTAKPEEMAEVLKVLKSKGIIA